VYPSGKEACRKLIQTIQLYYVFCQNILSIGLRQYFRDLIAACEDEVGKGNSTYQIEKGRALSENGIGFVVDLVMDWIVAQIR
jgi:hypothetical protein